MRLPFGAESTGLPASVTMARIWPWPGVSISSASTAEGRSPSVSGRPRTRLCQRSTAVQAAHARDAADVEGRRREHRPAFAAQPSGDDVQQVGREGRDRRVGADADADARVAHRRARVGELERQALDGGGRHAGEGGDARRGERGQAASRSPASRWSCAPGSARSTRPRSTRTWTIASRKAASPPGRMATCSSASFAVSVRRGSTTTTLPPRSRTRAQTPAHVGRGHDAAVRDHRVAAQAEEVVGAIDVGDRNRDRRAVQLVRRHDARVGVLRAGAEAVARAERLRERAQHQQRAVVVAGRVAPVEADRVAAVPRADLAEAAGDEIERVVPGDLLEARPPRCGAPAGAAGPDRRWMSAIAMPFGQT